MKITIKNTALRHTLFIVATAITLALSFTACDDYDDWGPYPPGGWNNVYYDSRLSGYWQLVEANSRPVYGEDSNWLYFNGGGRGVYYYYLNGRPFRETLAYFCQDTYGGPTNYQINVQYQNGESSTMYYWFEGRNTVVMQWRNNAGMQSYVYRRTGYAPF